MLFSICAPIIIQSKPLVAGSASSQPKAVWKSIVTKIGVTVSVPLDLGKAVPQGASAKAPTGETYSPKAWNGCALTLAKKPFEKEDPDESAAVKLEDVVYNEIDLEGDKVTRIAFGVLQGWPEVDIDVKKRDGGDARFRVCRTKSVNDLMSIAGKALPDDDVVKKLFASFRLPKSIATGQLTAWGPRPETVKLANAKLEIWTPVQRFRRLPRFQGR